jgi:hypothetical protein
VQQNTSKDFAAGGAGAMVACSLISYGGMRGMRHLLYHNPCSIAGSMSLLAGSRLVNDTAHDGNGDTGNAAERDTLLTAQDQSTRRLRLRWWESRSGENRYGIDVM